jgi:hypothetical protein
VKVITFGESTDLKLAALACALDLCMPAQFTLELPATVWEPERGTWSRLLPFWSAYTTQAAGFKLKAVAVARRRSSTRPVADDLTWSACRSSEVTRGGFKCCVPSDHAVDSLKQIGVMHSCGSKNTALAHLLYKQIK